MRCRISFRAGLFWGISLSGLLSSTSCADAATVTLEPLVSNSVSSFVLTSRLRVVDNSTDENDGDLFPIDLYSTDRITFILQPPKGIDEIRLSSSAPGKAIELIVRASLVEGPNADRCQSSNADANVNADADGDGAFDQLLVGAFFQASVAGRDADVLSEAFAWERSYVSIEKYGCGVEGRLFFQPTVDEGVILASIERVSWSARYDLDLLGGTGIGDGSSEEALYALASEGDALIRGGDASMVFGSEKQTSDSPADVAASNESTTSAGSSKYHRFSLTVAIFFAAIASLTGERCFA